MLWKKLFLKGNITTTNILIVKTGTSLPVDSQNVEKQYH